MAAEPTVQAFYANLDHAVVIDLRGPIRYTSAPALRRALDDMLALGATDTIIDLRSTTFIDSTGLGLLARVGQQALRSGRRAFLICPDNDVAVCLRSAAFDDLFVLVEEPPFETAPILAELPLTPPPGGTTDDLGRIILDAHRDLAALSAKNRDDYRDVIAALEADLARART